MTERLFCRQGCRHRHERHHHRRSITPGSELWVKGVPAHNVMGYPAIDKPGTSAEHAAAAGQASRMHHHGEWHREQASPVDLAECRLIVIEGTSVMFIIWQPVYVFNA